MEKQKEISAKSTKNEILEAYNDLLKKIQEDKPLDRLAEKKKEGDKEIVKAASQNSIEKIVKGLAEIKLDIGNVLDTLEEKLITEYKKLTELQQAIGIEQKELDEIHEIKVNADSLAALMQAQKEKRSLFEKEMEETKNSFESEMTQKRLSWKKEQEDYEISKKERDAKIKKERDREEEEYNYNLQMTRKKDNDIYEAKKAALEKELNERRVTVEKELNDKKVALEKELSERQAMLSSKEKEFEDLKTQVEEFPKKLEKVIKDTEKSVIESIETKYKHEAELFAKEAEGEKRLNQQLISALETKIKEQEEYVRQLNKKADEAGRQVQNIAIKAIEGAASQRIISKGYENAKEPIKGQ